MKLNVWKINDNRMTREEAQELANQSQRPITVLTYVRPPESDTHTREKERVRFRVRPQYRCMDDIQKRNRVGGGHWFEPSSMRFFASRVQGSFYGSKDGRAYFVSSERGPNGRRAYSVRVAEPDGNIRTVGEFQGYPTGRAAHPAARAASNA